MLGLKGVRVEYPKLIGAAWDEALSADRPTVIDAVVDADVPTLPPHITMSQAKSYAKALVKGDPNASAIVWQTIKRSAA
jgi:pyruvate dehydrogenase (quinone)